MHGFDFDELSAYPHSYNEKEIPLFILKSNIAKNIKEIDSVIGKRL